MPGDVVVKGRNSRGEQQKEKKKSEKGARGLG